MTAFQVHFNFPTATDFSNLSETFDFGRNFPTSLSAFQIHSVVTNFARFFPILLGSFQFCSALFNFQLSNLKLLNFSFFQLPFPTPPKNGLVYWNLSIFRNQLWNQPTFRKSFFLIYKEKWRTCYNEITSPAEKYSCRTFRDIVLRREFPAKYLIYPAVRVDLW